MAVSAIAGLVGAAGAAAAGITVFGLAATTLAGFAAAFALSAGMSLVSRALMPKPDMGAAMRGTTATVREPASSRKVVYGRARVGGSVIFLSNSGTKNEYLHLVIVYTGHAIDAFEKFYFNDKLVWENGSFVSDWGSYARINYYDGTQTAADANLVSESVYWTSDHKVLGSSYIHIRLKWDQKKFPQGVPNISAVIRGKKVYDPRTDTTAWSQNPALCLRDYLLDTKYGLGESESRINNSALVAAANLCDQSVSLKDGGSQTRFSMDGVIDTASSLKENIEAMLGTMGGRIVFSGGQYFISGSAYTSPTIDIDESVTVGEITVQTRQSRRSMYNGVKGVFLSEEKNYILADYPAQISSSYALEDGDPIYLDMTLPLVTNSVRAQRLAKIALLKSRQQTMVTIPLNLAGLKFKAGDYITVTNDKMGWSEKPFEVLDYSIQPSSDGAIIVNLNCIETSASVYDWTTSDELDLFDEGELDLYDGTTVQPPSSLVAVETTVIADDGTLLPSIRLNWTAASDTYVNRYEVQWQRAQALVDYGSVGDEYTVSENWQSITLAADNQFDYGSIDEGITTGEPDYNSTFTATLQYIIQNVSPSANYNVRVRSISDTGIPSSFVTTSITPQGDTDPPAIPASLTAVGGLKEISLSWQPPTDPDYSHVEVWENTVNNPSSAAKIAIATGDNYVRTGLNYNVLRYYWVKSVDYSGNASDLSSVASATTLFVDTDAFSEAVNNLFSEAGAYGIEPVASLPATGDFDGQIKYDTTANKLYRWDAATSTWTDDIFSITSGSVDLASFASGIEPVGIVSTLPNPSGYTGAQIVFNTSDNKLYRYTGTEWVSSVPTADLVGTILSENFSTSLRPIEVLSALPTTGNFQGRQVFLTTDNKLYRYNGTAFTSSVPTTDLSGTITSLQIANEAVTNAKIAVDAIQGDVIAAGAITAAKILDGAISELKLADDAVTTAKLANAAVTADIVAASAITATKISDGAVETAKLAANSVVASKISAGAIVADAISANAVTSEKILAGSVVADSIASGAITTVKLAAGAVTAETIAANTITSSQIASGTITASELASGSVTAEKIQSGSITSDKIDANAITTSKLAIGDFSILNQNPSFEEGDVAWSGEPEYSIVQEQSKSGSYSLKFAASNGAAYFYSSTQIPVEAGETFYADAYIKYSSGTEGAARVLIRAFNNAGAGTGGGSGTVITNQTTYTKSEATYTTDADDDYIVVAIYGIGATSVYYFDDVRLFRSATSVLIADGAITSDKIVANAITSGKIDAGAITADKLAANSVTATAISAASISADALQANAVTADKISANSVSADKLQANSVTSDKLQANSVTAGKVAAAAISTTELAAEAITAEKIASEVITSDKIAAGAIQGDRIAANTITGGLIAAAGIITTAAQIDDAVITNAKIANLAVTQAKIADLAVDTIKIADQAVTIPSSAFTATGVTVATVSSTFTTWVDIQSITWTSTAADTLMLFYCDASADNNNPAAYAFRILLNGTVLTTLGEVSMEGDNRATANRNFAISRVLSPNSGSNTVKIQAAARTVGGGASSATMYNRTMATLETKK